MFDVTIMDGHTYLPGDTGDPSGLLLNIGDDGAPKFRFPPPGAVNVQVLSDQAQVAFGAAPTLTMLAQLEKCWPTRHGGLHKSVPLLDAKRSSTIVDVFESDCIDRKWEYRRFAASAKMESVVNVCRAGEGADGWEGKVLRGPTWVGEGADRETPGTPYLGFRTVGWPHMVTTWFVGLDGYDVHIDEAEWDDVHGCTRLQEFVAASDREAGVAAAAALFGVDEFRRQRQAAHTAAAHLAAFDTFIRNNARVKHVLLRKTLTEAGWSDVGGWREARTLHYPTHPRDRDRAGCCAVTVATADPGTVSGVAVAAENCEMDIAGLAAACTERNIGTVACWQHPQHGARVMVVADVELARRFGPVFDIPDGAEMFTFTPGSGWAPSGAAASFPGC